MVTKAIIPIAGWGTRRLPITKVIEKSMLPIGNRPLVDYVVEDCIKAGITDIYFVVSEGSTQVQDYYGHNRELEEYLVANGKEDRLSDVTPPKNVTFHYIIQDTTGGSKYGTAIPVALAAPWVGEGESVVVLMGDDFIYNKDGSSEVKRLIEAVKPGESAMLGVEIPREDVSRYGVIEADANNNFVQIVEKPEVNEAPSNLINVSKYLVSRELLDEIVEFSKQKVEGEYYITDPINNYVAKGKNMVVVPSVGEYLDGGSVEGWLHANNTVLS